MSEMAKTSAPDLSDVHETAADNYLAASDERGVGSKIESSRGNFLGIPNPMKRNPRFHVSDESVNLGGGQADLPEDRRVNGARTHGVYADVPRGKFGGKRPAERPQGRFCR
jgi:hypothetical protein